MTRSKKYKRLAILIFQRVLLYAIIVCVLIINEQDLIFYI